jgi:serine/threonine protein kinase
MGSICSLLSCCCRRSSDEKSKTNTKPKSPKREVRTPADYLQVRRYLSTTKDIQVEVCVGNGNYADVYRAVTTKGKLVAVKVINLRKIEANYTTSFLPNEIKVLRKCRHNNILKVYEISQTEHWVFTVMEWAPYGTLADWLRDKGALTETQAVPIFIPILDAMHHMHTNRIAHRDLKLENILITGDHVPKISDFSYVVEYQKNEPKTTTVCGSLPYIR